jgi:hypothetical protein
VLLPKFKDMLVCFLLIATIFNFWQIKDEAWWLVLGNTKTWELYALKRISFSDHLTTSMVITPDQMNLEVVILMLLPVIMLKFQVFLQLIVKLILHAYTDAQMLSGNKIITGFRLLSGI